MDGRTLGVLVARTLALFYGVNAVRGLIGNWQYLNALTALSLAIAPALAIALWFGASRFSGESDPGETLHPTTTHQLAAALAAAVGFAVVLGSAGEFAQCLMDRFLHMGDDKSLPPLLFGSPSQEALTLRTWGSATEVVLGLALVFAAPQVAKWLSK